MNSNKGRCQQFNGTSLVACQYATRTCSLQGKLSETSPAAVRETLRRKFGHPGAGHRTGRLVGRQQPVAPSVSHRWWDATGSGASDWWALLLLQLRPGPLGFAPRALWPFSGCGAVQGVVPLGGFLRPLRRTCEPFLYPPKKKLAWRQLLVFGSCAVERPLQEGRWSFFNCHTANSLVGRGPPQPAHRPQSRRSK